MAKPPLNVVLGLMLLLGADGSRADPLNSWAWRFPYPQGFTLNAVAYGGGQFVAVGDNGTIITSTDGYNWTNRSFGVFPYLRGVAYADGEYAAVGDGGVILVSSNAATWTQLPSVSGNSLHGIAGDSSWRSDGLPQFLALGDSGTAIFGSNGTNWSVVSSGTSNTLYAAVSGSNIGLPRYLIVGAAGTVIRLTTAGFIQRPESSVGTTNNLYAVASAGNGHVAAGGDLTPNPFAYTDYYTNAILYSLSSGSTWTNQQWIVDEFGNPNLWYLSEFFILNGMTYGSNGFVGVGYTGYDLEYHPAVVMTSTTGTNWTELASSTSEDPLNGIAYGNNLYVAVGDFG